MDLANTKAFVAVKSELSSCTHNADVLLWKAETVDGIMVVLWGNLDRDRTRDLLRRSKPKYSRITGYTVLLGEKGLYLLLNSITSFRDHTTLGRK